MNYIKEMIFKKFFMVEKEMSDLYYESWMESGEKLGEAEKELRKLRQERDIFKNIFYKERDIIGFENNKRDYPLIITKYMDDDSLEIYLHSRYYRSTVPSIKSSITTDYINRCVNIIIDDLQMIDNSIGNGTIAMKHFLNQAKKIGCKKISGKLLPADKENFKRSIPYYEKFGFRVKLNSAGDAGTISLIIN